MQMKKVGKQLHLLMEMFKLDKKILSIFFFIVCGVIMPYGKIRTVSRILE